MPIPHTNIALFGILVSSDLLQHSPTLAKQKQMRRSLGKFIKHVVYFSLPISSMNQPSYRSTPLNYNCGQHKSPSNPLLLQLHDLLDPQKGTCFGRPRWPRFLFSFSFSNHSWLNVGRRLAWNVLYVDKISRSLFPTSCFALSSQREN